MFIPTNRNIPRSPSRLAARRAGRGLAGLLTVLAAFALLAAAPPSSRATSAAMQLSGTLLVGNRGAGNVLRIDPATDTVLQTISAPIFAGNVISDVEVNPSTGEIFVAVDTSSAGGVGVIAVFDVDGNFTHNVPLPDDTPAVFLFYPFGLDVGPDGTLWVARPNTGEVIQVVNDPAGGVLQTFVVGGNPEDVVLGDPGSAFIVDNGGDVQHLDLTTGVVTFLVSTGDTNLAIERPRPNLLRVGAAGLASGVHHFDEAGGVVPPGTVGDRGSGVATAPTGEFFASLGVLANRIDRFDAAGNLLGSLTGMGAVSFPFGLAIAVVPPEIVFQSPLQDQVRRGILQVQAEITSDSELAEWELFLDVIDPANRIAHASVSAPSTTVNVVLDTHVLPDGPYTLILRARDIFGGETTETVDFFVDNTPPVVILDSPLSGEVVTSPVALSGTVTDMSAKLVEILVDGVSAMGFAGGPGVFGFAVGVPIPGPSGPRTLTVRATDAAGNVGEASVTVQLAAASALPPGASPALRVSASGRVPGMLIETGNLNVNVQVRRNGTIRGRIVYRERGRRGQPSFLLNQATVTDVHVEVLSDRQRATLVGTARVDGVMEPFVLVLTDNRLNGAPSEALLQVSGVTLFNEPLLRGRVRIPRPR